MTKACLLLLVALSAGCVALSAGCATPRRPGTPSSVHEETFGFSVEGRPIRGRIYGSGNVCTLYFAVIHGDEPLGQPLLERFEQELVARPQLLRGRRVVVIPVVNPDGLRRGTRRNVRNVDLNRNFPAKNFRASEAHGPFAESEPETRVITKVMRQFNPRKVVAVHAPLDCINYDGPADEIARRMAEVSGYELKPSIGYPTPGSFGSYSGHDLNLPTITVELRDGITAEDAWGQLGGALLMFLEY